MQAARKGRGGKLANEIVIEVFINNASTSTKFSMSPRYSLSQRQYQLRYLSYRPEINIRYDMQYTTNLIQWIPTRISNFVL